MCEQPITAQRIREHLHATLTDLSLVLDDLEQIFQDLHTLAETGELPSVD